MELQEAALALSGDSPSPPPSPLISTFHCRVRGSHFQLRPTWRRPRQRQPTETLQYGEETNLCPLPPKVAVPTPSPLESCC